MNEVVQNILHWMHNGSKKSNPSFALNEIGTKFSLTMPVYLYPVLEFSVIKAV